MSTIRINVKKPDFKKTNRLYQAEALLTSTVGELKAELEQVGGLEGGSTCKLIHKGSVLKDDRVLASLGYTEGEDFLVAMLQPKSESTSAESAQVEEAPLRVGELVEGAWNWGNNRVEWLKCVVVVVHENGTYTVKWVGEEAYTEGVQRRLLRRFQEADAPLEPVDMQAAVGASIPEAMSKAMEDPEFRKFLESPAFAASMKPLKDAARNTPEQLPAMLGQIKMQDPQAMLLIAPFMMAELEDRPALQAQVAAIIQA